MSIRFKNAGFERTNKDIKEALKRIIDGEKFYRNGQLVTPKVYEALQTKVVTPFLLGEDLYLMLNRADFLNIEEWEVEVDWRENIGKGVWCWVWDNPLTEDKHPELVTEYDNSSEYEYRDAYGTVWRYARPMTREEVENYIWGD